MAVPKNRSSKSRTRRKHSINSKLRLPHVTINGDTGDYVLYHRVDQSDGNYRNKKIINTTE